jgi:hypothetical protein
MTNTALQRITQAVLTNKSGGSVALGDVVIIDSSTASSFTTTTTSPFLNGVIGVVIEPNGIASNAAGMVAFAGPVPQINLSGSASLGDLFKTHTVAKQAVRHAAGIVAGDFGVVLGTGTTPPALLWGLPAGATGAGSGDFVGPGSAADGNLVLFNGTTGKLGKDGGAPVIEGSLTDYSGTSTVTGWGSFSTKSIYYRQIGHIMHVVFSLAGTSNATSASFTVPTASASNPGVYDVAFRAENNGSFGTAPGLLEMNSSSSTVNLYKDLTGATWTASGTKACSGEFYYFV